MRQALLASVALTGILAGGPVLALDNDELVAQLKSMQAQMAQMQKEMGKLKEELARNKEINRETVKIAQQVKDAKMALKPESDVKISMVPAPKFETADGAYSFKVGGFAQLDAGMFSNDRRDLPNGANIRRARINAAGTIDTDWGYKLEYDFSPNASSGGAAITDAYLEYTGFKPITLTAGQFKEPFSLEELTSDLFVTFMERASLNAFSPSRNIGFQVSSYGDSPLGAWSAAGGFFGGNATLGSNDDEPIDLTGRLTLAPIASGTEVLHFGVAGSHRVPDSATDSFAFSQRPEARITNSLLSVNTGTITLVEDVDLLGLEAAGVYGPFSLQGEYVKADVNRRGANLDQQFDSYYVEASYFLTGESRNYSTKSGKFDRVKPKWAFNPSEGQWGAWQVAGRYSVLDLNDSVIRGGEMKNATFGLRWIPHPNLSFMANYIKVNTDTFSVSPNDDPDIYMMRAQFDF